MNKYLIAATPFLIVIIHNILHSLGIESICIWHLVTGHKCWGCGITTAIVYMLSGKTILAYKTNPFVIIIAPLLLCCWINYIQKVFKQTKESKR